MIENKLSLPAAGEITVTGEMKKYLDFILSQNILGEKNRRMFVSAYTEKYDTDDLGWRGEYWGKTMRGACLVYRATGDRALYADITEAVEAILGAAEEDGRISTYTRETEFHGWDMWCRKYILTGLLHFIDISEDPALSARALEAAEKHTDYIIARCGEITKTSDYWLGVNSCSILEPVVDLYFHTGKKKYLDYAAYIVSTGGVDGDDNLIDLAIEDRLAPFEYPETKAYETMSFFEGVLEYYRATGEEKYLTAVLNFVEAVYRTDVTAIGCCGCTHELFDNSYLKQTEESDGIMQETCVTVTLMRLCAKLYLLTGDEKYAGRIEISAVNALYGSVNTKNQKHILKWNGNVVDPLPFDSYSPLTFGTRGRSVGGFKDFPDGSYYGCCACIGAAGIGLWPLVDSMRKNRNTDHTLTSETLNGMISFSYGPYVLARDEEKEDGDIRSVVVPVLENGEFVYTLEEPRGDETVRITLKTENGPVLLTDYASCGKYFFDRKGLVTVWCAQQAK